MVLSISMDDLYFCSLCGSFKPVSYFAAYMSGCPSSDFNVCRDCAFVPFISDDPDD